MTLQSTLDRASLELRPDAMMAAAERRLRLGAIADKAWRWKSPARPYDRAWFRRLHPDTTGHFVRAALDEGDDLDLIRAIRDRVRTLARTAREAPGLPGVMQGAETMRVVLCGEIQRLKARRKLAAEPHLRTLMAVDEFLGVK